MSADLFGTTGRALTDELDVRILRELTQAGTVVPARPGFRASYRHVARTLGVSPGTVRNRIGRMYASGVITGVSVYANPNLLGLEAGAYAVEVPPGRRKQEVVQRLRKLEGMYFVQNFRGSLLGLAFVVPDEVGRRRLVDEVHRITGAKGGAFTRVIYPPCDLALSASEWRLVSRLMRGSFSTYSALGRELGISVRTVKRRTAKLVRHHAILSVPTLDYRAFSGCVPADLLVVFSSPAARSDAERKVLALVGDRMIFAGVWADFGLYSLILPKVSEATQLEEAASRIPGVGTARVEIVEEHIDQVEVLRPFVDRQWGSPPTTRARSSKTAAG
jgi:DNA-binding Lrp family transcriptional regulator